MPGGNDARQVEAALSNRQGNGTISRGLEARGRGGESAHKLSAAGRTRSLAHAGIENAPNGQCARYSPRLASSGFNGAPARPAHRTALANITNLGGGAAAPAGPSSNRLGRIGRSERSTFERPERPAAPWMGSGARSTGAGAPPPLTSQQQQPAPLQPQQQRPTSSGAASVPVPAAPPTLALPGDIARSAADVSPTRVGTLPVLPAAAFPGGLGAPVEEDERDNVQHVGDYAADICGQLFRDENCLLPHPDYMDTQPDINGRMRAILVDWLIEVHLKYRLRPETLFLTVNLIDRYLTRMPVMRRRLQLVGVAAMFVASKFEEITPPEVQDFVYITDNAYTRENLLQMECTMLTTLGFQLVSVTPVHFMDRLQRANRCNSLHRELAQYLVELALLDIKMVRHPPSRLVSAALLLSNELLGRYPVWPPTMVQQARHTEQQLRGCADEFRALLLAAPHNSLQAVRKKYLAPEHHGVATMYPAAAP